MEEGEGWEKDAVMAQRFVLPITVFIFSLTLDHESGTCLSQTVLNQDKSPYNLQEKWLRCLREVSLQLSNFLNE